MNTPAGAEKDIRPDRLHRVPWSVVAVFVLVSFSLAWLVILPLWLTETRSETFSSLAGVLPASMMFTPLIAVLTTVFVMRVPRGERLRFLGIWPLRPARRVVWLMAVSAVAPLLIVLASLGVSVLFGWVQLDLVNLSGFQAMLETPLDHSSLWPVVLLLVSGAVWGLWHAPMTLLGHNFNSPHAGGVALMVVGSVAWGVLFGWVRLRSGSIWPAVIGHGTLNASGGLVLIFAAADSPMNMALVNPLGVSGWIVLALIAATLALTGQFRLEPQLAPRRDPRLAPRRDPREQNGHGRPAQSSRRTSHHVTE